MATHSINNIPRVINSLRPVLWDGNLRKLVHFAPKIWFHQIGHFSSEGTPTCQGLTLQHFLIVV